MNSTPTPPDNLRPLVIRRNKLAQILGVSDATVDRLIADRGNGFPSAVHLGAKARGFRLDELQAWIASRQDSVKH